MNSPLCNRQAELGLFKINEEKLLTRLLHLTYRVTYLNYPLKTLNYAH